MAIINCPSCNKRTTELSSRCPHCGFERGQKDDARQVEMMSRKLRDRVYHLNMTSYAVITLFLVAFGWYWWDTAGFQRAASNGPLVLLAAGTIAYLAIRVLLFRARKELRRFSR